MRTTSTAKHRKRWIGLTVAAAMVGATFLVSTPPASASPSIFCSVLDDMIVASQHGGELSGNPVWIEAYQAFC